MEIGGQGHRRFQGVVKPVQGPVMRKFSTKPLAKSNTFLVLGTLAMIMAGIVTGYLLSGYSFADSGSQKQATGEPKGVKVSENEAGIEDVSDDKDILVEEGVLVEGGLEGEGTHHLDRGTGVEKYVYLTSTAFDLQSFVGKKVKVWGKALSALHVGYLMDVVKIKTIN